VPFEKLHCPLVLLRGFSCDERPQVPAPTGLRIHFSRIQAVFPGFDFSDHAIFTATPRPLTMNDADFRRHLKDLAHGHHHPEEHDWDEAPGAASRKAAAPKAAAAKRRAPRKTAKRK
jgi:hypothetical protein